MRKGMITFSVVLLFFLLLGTTYASEISSDDNESSVKIDNEILNKTTLDAPDSLNLVYRNGYYSATLKDENKNPIANENINISVNGVTYPRITNEEGIATLPIRLNPGTYLITADHMSFTKNTTLNVFSKDKCHILADDYECEYTLGTYKIKVLSENNLPIQYGEIDLKINGITYTRLTDENGIATLPIGLYPRTYSIEYTFGRLTGLNFINVKPLNCTVKAIDVNGSYDDYSYFSIEVSKNGSYLSDKVITTEVYKDGKYVKSYLTKTHDNGVGKFKIDLNPGNYTFKSFCNDFLYKSNYCENTVMIRKTNTIAISQDLHLNRIGEEYTVILKNNETQLPISNEVILITVNGVSYPCITDENGKAGLKICLNEKTYIITYEYEGNTGYNGVKGTNILIRDHNKISTNIEVLNSEVTRYEDEVLAKLTDENNIPLAKQPLTFTVNTVNYIRFTDKNGIASLPIRLLDNKYDFKIKYNGNNLFKNNENKFILNVNKSSNFNYSFAISKTKEFGGEEYSLIRYIDLIYQNKVYTYTTDTKEYKGTLLKKNNAYFLSFDYKTSRLVDINQIKSQGISIEVTDENFIITYYGRLSNITQFDVVFDHYEDSRSYGEIATIIVNNQIEAKIKFSEYIFYYDDYFEISDKGYNPFISEIEELKTTLNALGFSHNKTLQLDYYNSFKTTQSYLITNSEIKSEYVYEYLKNYVKSSFNYDLQAQENNLISLYTLWASQCLDNYLAETLNCSWKENAIVLTTTEWSGMNIHSAYSLEVDGNESSKWSFKNLHGLLFSYSEQLALEFAGIEAKSATSEILEGLAKGEAVIFDLKNDEMNIKSTNSTSEIVINMTTGNTNCLLGTDPINLINNFKYKGASSENHVSNSYPKESVKEYNFLSNFENDIRNIFSADSKEGFKRYALNEIRTNKNKVLGSIQSVLIYFNPKTGGIIFGAIQSMLYIGEYTVNARNMYAPASNYQYFSYHTPIWSGKTITILDDESGYIDYIEIPYKANGELNIDYAIYIEGESGARNLTDIEAAYYGSL